MSFQINQVVYDPLTGDKGRVIGFAHDDSPIAQTKGGRLFNNGRDARGFRSLTTKYADGDVKVCNCADCGELLLSQSHKDELDRDREAGRDVESLPRLIRGYRNDRPYCPECF